MAFACAYLDHQ